VGSDVGLHVGKNFVESFPERVYTSALIPLLNQHKRLGEKTKVGFYKYDDRRRASPDPTIAAIIKVRAAPPNPLHPLLPCCFCAAAAVPGGALAHRTLAHGALDARD
jgi:3-hydroxyacyl-CoA dehydrogenase